MPSVAVKLYSVFFKLILKRRLQNRIQNPNLKDENSSFGVTSRPEESIAAANPSFTDGVATKDIHIETSTSLALRIFLPDTCLVSTDSNANARVTAKRPGPQSGSTSSHPSCGIPRRNSYDSAEAYNAAVAAAAALLPINRRNSYGNGLSTDDMSLQSENGAYRGYSPFTRRCRKLPVMVQFHGGGFVAGSCDSVANDFFCRQIAKVCDVIVLAVGYRLAPENKYPAAFEDGMKALHWLAKQVNLAECSKSSGRTPELKRSDVQGQIKDAFGASLVEPWLAAHGDPSRR